MPCQVKTAQGELAVLRSLELPAAVPAPALELASRPHVLIAVAPAPAALASPPTTLVDALTQTEAPWTREVSCQTDECHGCLEREELLATAEQRVLLLESKVVRLEDLDRRAPIAYPLVSDLSADFCGSFSPRSKDESSVSQAGDQPMDVSEVALDDSLELREGGGVFVLSESSSELSPVAATTDAERETPATEPVSASNHDHAPMDESATDKQSNIEEAEKRYAAWRAAHPRSSPVKPEDEQPAQPT